MKTDGHTISGDKTSSLQAGLESVKEWANRALTKERIADIIVCASTVTVLGLVLDILHRAMESSRVVGTTPF